MKYLLLFVVFPIVIALLATQLISLDWIADKLRKPFPNVEKVTWTNKVDVSIRNFILPNFTDDFDDMMLRLTNTRFPKAVDTLKFNYGVDQNILKDLVAYVKTEISLKKIYKVLNKAKHYITKIHGIDVHYLHYKDHIVKNKKTIPLLIIHGWPGSFIEHMESAQMLQDPSYVAKHLGINDIQFEIIIPSIPGFLFSETPPIKHNETDNTFRIFGLSDAAFIFHDLMLRLKQPKYFIQGGDWGSFIGQAMARLFPTNVDALHINFLALPILDFRLWLSLLKNYVYPDASFTKKDLEEYYPVYSKIFTKTLKKTGYFHLQATRPDSLGTGLDDSPIGQFAYIFEKLALATKADYNMDFMLTRKLFTPERFDKILINMILYWLEGKSTSSMRFYAGYISDKNFLLMRQPNFVPTGIAEYPNEIGRVRKEWAMFDNKNLIYYSTLHKGGHFASLECPDIFTSDLLQFIGKRLSFSNK